MIRVLSRFRQVPEVPPIWLTKPLSPDPFPERFFGDCKITSLPLLCVFLNLGPRFNDAPLTGSSPPLFRRFLLFPSRSRCFDAPKCPVDLNDKDRPMEVCFRVSFSRLANLGNCTGSHDLILSVFFYRFPLYQICFF